MTVNTIVIDVPMLNAAPPLRVSVIVRAPPSRRIFGWAGIVATTTALETTSAARTNRATASSSPTRRGRAAFMRRELIREVGAGIPAAPRPGRPARPGARDPRPLAGRGDIRAVAQADRGRTRVGLLRAAADRQRDGGRAPRGGPHLQGPVSPVQDHA